MILSITELFAYLKQDRRRTIIALLGIAMGTTSLVLMDTISGGMRKKVEMELGRLGALLVMVVPGEVRAIGQRRVQFSRYTTLKPADVRKIRTMIPFVREASGLKKKAVSVKDVVNESSLVVTGVEPCYFRLLDYKVDSGTVFTKRAMDRKRKVVVLGAKAAADFFESPFDAIGKSLELGGTPFRVIGVLAKRGSFSNEDFDETLFIPLATEMTILENVDFLDGAVVQVSSRNELAPAISDVEGLLEKRHGRKDFTLNTYQEVQGTAAKTLHLFSLLSRIVAFVAFCVGTLGILAIMALSIYERLLEIAVKRVAGAKKRDIFLQLLTESMFLSLAGSSAGVVFSVTVGLFVQFLASWPLFLPIRTILVSMVLSIVTGISAGIYPAIKALEFEPRYILRLFEEL